MVDVLPMLDLSEVEIPYISMILPTFDLSEVRISV